MPRIGFKNQIAPIWVFPFYALLYRARYRSRFCSGSFLAQCIAAGSYAHGRGRSCDRPRLDAVA
jgi:hypothetical protein